MDQTLRERLTSIAEKEGYFDLQVDEASPLVRVYHQGDTYDFEATYVLTEGGWTSPRVVAAEKGGIFEEGIVETVPDDVLVEIERKFAPFRILQFSQPGAAQVPEPSLQGRLESIADTSEGCGIAFEGDLAFLIISEHQDDASYEATWHLKDEAWTGPDVIVVPPGGTVQSVEVTDLPADVAQVIADRFAPFHAAVDGRHPVRSYTDHLLAQLEDIAGRHSGLTVTLEEGAIVVTQTISGLVQGTVVVDHRLEDGEWSQMQVRVRPDGSQEFETMPPDDIPSDMLLTIDLGFDEMKEAGSMTRDDRRFLSVLRRLAEGTDKAVLSPSMKAAVKDFQRQFRALVPAPLAVTQAYPESAPQPANEVSAGHH